MKISRYDRLQAVQRLPEFIKKHKKYRELIRKRDEAGGNGRLRSRYANQVVQVDYEIESRWQESPEAIMNADKLKGRSKSVEAVQAISSFYKPILILHSETAECREDNGTVTVSGISEKSELIGDRLYLSADIRDTKENLMESFERVVDYYKKILPENKDRKNRRTELDPWEIYDMHHEGGLNFSQIARKKFMLKSLSKNEKKVLEFKGKDTNKDFKEALKKVNNAYKQACQIIKAVSPL